MYNNYFLIYSDKSNYFLDLNPLLPSVSCMARLTKIFISILEGIIKNFSYERLGYESVDEKSLS